MKLWKRKGLFYYAELSCYRGPYTWVVTKKLDFVSCHLIKWWHGERKLTDMAMTSAFNDLTKG